MLSIVFQFGLGIGVAVLSFIARRFDLGSGSKQYTVFCGISYNIGRLISQKTTTGIACAALCAVSLFMLPFSLGGVADWITWLFAASFALFEVFLVVTSVHRWGAAAAERVHKYPEQRSWPAALLAISFGQLVFSLYLLAFRVEEFGWLFAGVSAVVVVHNVVAEEGIIVAATSCVFAGRWVCCLLLFGSCASFFTSLFFPSVFLAIGTSNRMFVGTISGQLVTPLLLGAMGGYDPNYAVFALLCSLYARTDMRTIQAFLVVLASPVFTIFYGRMKS